MAWRHMPSHSDTVLTMFTGLLTERTLTQTSMQTSRRDLMDDLDTPIQPAAYETQPQFLPLRMNETLLLGPCTPAPGEIFVFRFRSQWQRVSAHDSAQWLTQDETRRAALLTPELASFDSHTALHAKGFFCPSRSDRT